MKIFVRFGNMPYLADRVQCIYPSRSPFPHVYMRRSITELPIQKECKMLDMNWVRKTMNKAKKVGETMNNAKKARPTMKIVVVKLLVLLTMVGIALQPISVARAVDNKNGPELPPQCGSIRVDEGHKLAFHVYARGVQIYKWNATNATWDFDAPRASLFAEANYFGEVGDHYRGPTWESKSGSIVRARRVLNTGCLPNSSAIEWLLLESTFTSGPGIFSGVTYIQRTNTTGGLRPTAPGSTEGEIREVPYTAEYYFYRAENPAGL
jgi:hypothetical protein